MMFEAGSAPVPTSPVRRNLIEFFKTPDAKSIVVEKE